MERHPLTSETFFFIEGDVIFVMAPVGLVLFGRGELSDFNRVDIDVEYNLVI